MQPDDATVDLVSVETDPLTGFETRNRLLARLDSANEAATLALFHLAGFAEHAAAHGQLKSEAVLKELAHALAESVGPEATFYRPRYDEFAVLIGSGGDHEQVLADAVRTVNKRFAKHAIELEFGFVSIPFDAADASSALALADQRLFLRSASRRPRERRTHQRPTSWE